MVGTRESPLRKRTVILLGLGLVLAVLALLALGWFPQEVLRSSLEARLRAALGPKSSVKGIHVVPGGLRAEVWDLVIEGPTYRLEVPRAQVSLAAGFIFGRDLVLNSVWMENPRLRLHPVPSTAKEPTLKQPAPTAEEIVNTLAERDSMRAGLLRQMHRVPLILMPACGIPAFRHRERRWQTGEKEIGLFQAMIFSALLESGTSSVHAINERIDHAWNARTGGSLSRRARLTIALVLLVGCMVLASRFGLVALIANGYRALSYVLLATYILPLVTVGVWKIWRHRPEQLDLDLSPETSE